MEERTCAASDRAANKAIFLRLDQLLLRFDFLVQALQCALQLHTSRGLQQHHVSGAKIFGKPVAGFFWLMDKFRKHAARSRSFHYKAGSPADSEQNIDLALRNVIPAVAMQLRRHWTELEHFTGYHNPPLSPRSGENIHHSFQRLWIGVVAVIDQGCPGNFYYLSALVRSFKRSQRNRSLGGRNSSFERNRNSGQCVHRVVTSKQGQLGLDCYTTCGKLESRASWSKVFDLFCAHVSRMLNPKLNHFAMKVTPELGYIRIIGVQ